MRNEISFIKASKKQNLANRQEAIHYVLMLDESGSMRGERWKLLMNSVLQFLGVLQEQQENQGSISKVSVLTHSIECRRIFILEQPHTLLIRKIKPIFSGNNFIPVFAEALEIFEETYPDFDKVVFYFMSDGVGNFPGKVIQNFNHIC